MFWSDSEFVLAYINNYSGGFKIFVAYRVLFICNSTNAEQHHYKSTYDNPPDNTSRELDWNNLGRIKRGVQWSKNFSDMQETWLGEDNAVSLINERDIELKNEISINLARIN